MMNLKIIRPLLFKFSVYFLYFTFSFPHGRIPKACRKEYDWDIFDLISVRFQPRITWRRCLFSLPILLPSLPIIWQIPRIILTHPSTSDEDVEPLTQSPNREPPPDFDIPRRRVRSACFDSAFYPPWPRPRDADAKDADWHHPAPRLKHVQLPSVDKRETDFWNVFFSVSQVQLLLIIFQDTEVSYKIRRLSGSFFITLMYSFACAATPSRDDKAGPSCSLKSSQFIAECCRLPLLHTTALMS